MDTFNKNPYMERILRESQIPLGKDYFPIISIYSQGKNPNGPWMGNIITYVFFERMKEGDPMLKNAPPLPSESPGYFRYTVSDDYYFPLN